MNMDNPLFSDSQRSYLRAKFLFLCDDCPVQQGNPSDCPFHNVRGKSTEEKMAWFDRLDAEAILNIHTYCQLCFEVKEKLGIK